MKQGFIFWGIFIVILLPFFISDSVLEFYKSTNTAHPYLLGFFKFAILSTAGELIGLRIKKGYYFTQGFGIAARMLVWGILGVGITLAMKIFSGGVPPVLESLGADNITEAMKGGFSYKKLLGAFGISMGMNCFFAPIMMTVHKITDTQILNCGGNFMKFITTRLPFGKILAEIDWKVQWNFVFKKTIPFFWIPAHTITFMLPAEYQVLFAASLGIALGIILSVSARMAGK